VRIGVLNNLRAGRSRHQVDRILEFLDARRGIVHVETPCGDAVPEALSRLAAEGVDVLVVQGGDGTLARALTEILEHGVFRRPPLIAPLRGGRTNMTALEIGMSRDPVRALRNLVAAARHGSLERHVRERAVLRLAIPSEGVVHHGMFFGAGVVQRAIALVHRTFPRGRTQGVFASGIVTSGLVARAALGDASGILDPDKIQLRLDGGDAETGSYQLLIASTLDRLFLRMRPFWGRGPGSLRLTAITREALHLRRAALGILRGRPPVFVHHTQGYSSRNVEQAELLLDCGFTVDGEIFAPEPGRHVELTADRRLGFVRL
jgi:hypothetical protein